MSSGFDPRSEDVPRELLAEWGTTQRIIGEQGQSISVLAEQQKSTNIKLDRLIETLERRMSSSGDNLRGEIQTVAATNEQKIDALSRSLDQKTSKDIWKILGGIGGFMAIGLTVIFGYLNMKQSADNRRFDGIMSMVENVSGSLQAHQQLEGHPTGMSAIRNTTRRLDELRERNEKHYRDKFANLQRDVDRALNDLASRSGRRWNREDHRTEVAPILEGHRKEIAALREAVFGNDRFTKTDAQGMETRVRALEQIAAEVKTLINEARAEQLRRTEKVLGLK